MKPQALREPYDLIHNHFNREEPCLGEIQDTRLESHHQKYELVVKEMHHDLTTRHQPGEILSNIRTFLHKWVIQPMMVEDDNPHDFYGLQV